MDLKAMARQKMDEAARMMHDLGGDRRERIVTMDIQKQGPLDLHAVENRRRSNQVGTKEHQLAGQRVKQLDLWNNAYLKLQNDGGAGEEDFAGGQSHRKILSLGQAVSHEVERGRGQALRGGRNGRGGRGGGNVGRNAPRSSRDSLPRPRMTGPGPTTAQGLSNDARNWTVGEAPRRGSPLRRANVTAFLNGTPTEVAHRYGGTLLGNSRESETSSDINSRDSRPPRHPGTAYVGQLASPNDFMTRFSETFGGSAAQAVPATAPSTGAQVSISQATYESLVSAQQEPETRLDIVRREPPRRAQSQESRFATRATTAQPGSVSNELRSIPLKDERVEQQGQAAPSAPVVITGDLLHLSGEHKPNESYSSDLAGLEYSADSPIDSEDRKKLAADRQPGYDQDAQFQRTPQSEHLTHQDVSVRIATLREAIQTLRSVQTVVRGFAVSTTLSGLEQQARYLQHALDTNQQIPRERLERRECRDSSPKGTSSRRELKRREDDSERTPRRRPRVRLPSATTQRAQSPSSAQIQRHQSIAVVNRAAESATPAPPVHVSRPTRNVKSLAARLNQIKQDWVKTHIKVGLEHSVHGNQVLPQRRPREGFMSSGIGDRNLPGQSSMPGDGASNVGTAPSDPFGVNTRSNRQALSVVREEARVELVPSTAVTSTSTEEDLAARIQSIDLHGDSPILVATAVSPASLNASPEASRSNSVNYSPQQMMQLRAVARSSRSSSKTGRLHARDEDYRGLEEFGQPRAKSPKKSQDASVNSARSTATSSQLHQSQRVQTEVPIAPRSMMTGSGHIARGRPQQSLPASSRNLPNNTITQQYAAASTRASMNVSTQDKVPAPRSNVPDNAITRQYTASRPDPAPVNIPSGPNASTQRRSTPNIDAVNRCLRASLPGLARSDGLSRPLQESTRTPASNLPDNAITRQYAGLSGAPTATSEKPSRPNAASLHSLGQTTSISQPLNGGQSRWSGPASEHQPRAGPSGSVPQRGASTEQSLPEEQRGHTQGRSTRPNEPPVTSTSNREQMSATTAQARPNTLIGSSRWAITPPVSGNQVKGSSTSQSAAVEVPTHRRESIQSSGSDRDPEWDHLYSGYSDRREKYKDRTLPKWFKDVQPLPDIAAAVRKQYLQDKSAEQDQGSQSSENQRPAAT